MKGFGKLRLQGSLSPIFLHFLRPSFVFNMQTLFKRKKVTLKEATRTRPLLILRHLALITKLRTESNPHRRSITFTLGIACFRTLVGV